MRRSQADEGDFLFWSDGLTPKQRVEAVGQALESCLKTRGGDGVPRLRRVHRRVECPWRPVSRRGGPRGRVPRTPRATQDLDILIDPTPANARRALAALRDFFGGADLAYSVEDVTDPRWIIQLGAAPVRIDLISEIPGLASFQAAGRKRVSARFGSVPAHYIGIDELIRAKEAVPRRLLVIAFTSRASRRSIFPSKNR